MSSPLVLYACSLHASTDFREKLYKVFQTAAKLAACQPGAGPRPKQIASTLSQSRGIFKLLKWVNNIDGYQKASTEGDPLMRRLAKLEAVLNTIVTCMQDAISLDKLCGAKVVSERFSWWMNLLDLHLSVLLAGVVSLSIARLLSGGADPRSPKVARKLLLLRLELGVRLSDTFVLLEATALRPSGRRFWPCAPSPKAAMLANILSAIMAAAGVSIKRWAALPAPTPVVEQVKAAAPTIDLVEGPKEDEYRDDGGPRRRRVG